MTGGEVFNYADIDNKTIWNYRVDLWKLVRDHGFESISEAYHKKYIETGSLSETGKIFGVEGNSVRYILKKLGVKIKGRGGPNHKSKLLPILKNMPDIQNKTISQLVKETGYHENSIRANLKKIGVR